MLKGLPINPYISINSSLEEIETELSFLIDYAENKLDWEISQEDEKQLGYLTTLAKAKGTKVKW